eukprot:EG_transcript_10723
MAAAWATVDLAEGAVHLLTEATVPAVWRAYLAVVGAALHGFVHPPPAADGAAPAPPPAGRLTLRSLTHHKERLSAKYHSAHAHDPQRADNAAFHHYDEAQSRLAYLLFFVPRHARALAQALAAVGDPIAKDMAAAWQQKRPFAVASVGGGPGADLFGFLLYLAEHPSLSKFEFRQLRFSVLDLPEWRAAWKQFRHTLAPLFPGLSLSFQAADCTNPQAASMVPAGVDLLLLCNVLAEMQAAAEPFADFSKAAVARVRPGGHVLSLEPLQDAASTLKRRILCISKAEVRVLTTLSLSEPDGHETCMFKAAGPALVRCFKLWHLAKPRPGGSPPVLALAAPSTQQPAEAQLWRRTDHCAAAAAPAPAGPATDAAPQRRKKKNKKRRRSNSRPAGPPPDPSAAAPPTQPPSEGAAAVPGAKRRARKRHKASKPPNSGQPCAN